MRSSLCDRSRLQPANMGNLLDQKAEHFGTFWNIDGQNWKLLTPIHAKDCLLIHADAGLGGVGPV
jgi:hypothetical protein